MCASWDLSRTYRKSPSQNWDLVPCPRLSPAPGKVVQVSIRICPVRDILARLRRRTMYCTGINLLLTPDFLTQLEPRNLLALGRLEHVVLFSVFQSSWLFPETREYSLVELLIQAFGLPFRMGALRLSKPCKESGAQAHRRSGCTKCIKTYLVPSKMSFLKFFFMGQIRIRCSFCDPSPSGLLPTMRCYQL